MATIARLKHRARDPFDGAVVLLDDVVQIFALTQFDLGSGVSFDAFNGRRVGTAFVDHLRQPVGQGLKGFQHGLVPAAGIANVDVNNSLQGLKISKCDSFDIFR